MNIVLDLILEGILILQYIRII